MQAPWPTSYKPPEMIAPAVAGLTFCEPLHEKVVQSSRRATSSHESVDHQLWTWSRLLSRSIRLSPHPSWEIDWAALSNAQANG